MTRGHGYEPPEPPQSGSQNPEGRFRLGGAVPAESRLLLTPDFGLQALRLSVGLRNMASIGRSLLRFPRDKFSIDILLEAGKFHERRASQSVTHPSLHGPRANRAIELHRGLVPIQHAPLQPPTTFAHCDTGEVLQQGLADIKAAMCGCDVQVFQVEALPAPQVE